MFSEYPAAHGCFSGASTETLNYLFGTDEVGFSMDSTVAGVVNPVRTYNRLSDALAEVLDARIHGGMHYRNSTRMGTDLGKQVSRFTTRHFFRPTKHHGNETNEHWGGVVGSWTRVEQFKRDFKLVKKQVRATADIVVLFVDWK